MDFSIPRPKALAKLPEILSREEVTRILSRPKNPKHRVLLMTAYGAGLRVSELVRLRVRDLDSDRMTIRVEQGKGAQDRYTLLSLRLLARDPRHLGGELGITAVLHTWGQNLGQHIHLHCVMTGGALTSDGSRWISTRKHFLFPVRALSKVFRGKVLAALRAAHTRGSLPAAIDTSPLLRTLHGTPWVVYAKPPFGGPAQVLAYLGRYTHRIAISNERILALHDGVVYFRWRDYADHHRSKVMALPAEEFLRRFVLHVVPAGFQRIRHFGLLANRRCAQALARCRELLHTETPAIPMPRETTVELVRRLTGRDLGLCPACGEGTLRVVAPLTPEPSTPPIRDTS